LHFDLNANPERAAFSSNRNKVALHKKLLRRNDSVILAQLTHFASHAVSSLALFQEDQAVGFSPMELWDHMGWPVRIIALTLFVESIWSLAVMIDRYLYFSAARKQSREFAPKVAGALKDSKLEEAIKIATGTRSRIWPKL